VTGCPECGFDLAAVDVDGPAAGTPLAWHYDETNYASAADRITAGAAGAAAFLRTTDDGALRRRPQPDVWSPLEYACHVRDVLFVQRERVLQVRCGDGDVTTAMRRDERVVFEGYGEQDPEDVAVQLHHAALLFTNVLRRLGPEDWDRTIAYRFPQPTHRSLRWVAVHTAHEVVHHVHDMRS
jgi:hypothetical protein